ncbi:hypothetical protein TIFTF001_055391, partial [Ficus carica]
RRGSGYRLVDPHEPVVGGSHGSGSVLSLSLSNYVWETVNLSHRFSLSAEPFFALKEKIKSKA